LKARLLVAAVLAITVWVPTSVRTASAIYCYPGDPPAVYQACLAYNAGIGQQVNNEQQLQNIRNKIADVQSQINATYALIKSLNDQIAAQKDLITKTQAAIDDLNRKIRFGEADVTRLQARMSVRDELLDQRLRYVDNHGAVNYAELVLTANNFNDMMNRVIGAQEIAASDQRLLSDLQLEHAGVAQANTSLGIQRDQVTNLLKQQKATEVDLEKNQVAQQAALVLANQLEVQLQSQYAQIAAQRAAIDAAVAKLQQLYDAAAAKAGGGSGVFAWPEPACGPSCISQGFGCSTFYLEPYDGNCPYPHRIHTGIDIAGPYGTPLVAADTGIIYFYAGAVGYGNYVLMIHGNGYSTVYGHMASFNTNLHNGQIVARGDLIGYEGSTGWSTGPHVHFEVRVYNVWKNPCIWLGC
jgi:murein DD-endopeptidase MepM/ murein hydrolase activator NlpD